MFPCGGTISLTLVTVPRLFPLQTSTASAELWPSPSGASTDATSTVMLAASPAPLMASTAVLPSAMGFLHTEEIGPAVLETPASTLAGTGLRITRGTGLPANSQQDTTRTKATVARVGGQSAV